MESLNEFLKQSRKELLEETRGKYWKDPKKNSTYNLRRKLLRNIRLWKKLVKEHLEESQKEFLKKS